MLQTNIFFLGSFIFVGAYCSSVVFLHKWTQYTPIVRMMLWAGEGVGAFLCFCCFPSVSQTCALSMILVSGVLRTWYDMIWYNSSSVPVVLRTWYDIIWYIQLRYVILFAYPSSVNRKQEHSCAGVLRTWYDMIWYNS